MKNDCGPSCRLTWMYAEIDSINAPMQLLSALDEVSSVPGDEYANVRMDEDMRCNSESELDENLQRRLNIFVCDFFFAFQILAMFQRWFPLFL